MVFKASVYIVPFATLTVIHKSHIPVCRKEHWFFGFVAVMDVVRGR